MLWRVGSVLYSALSTYRGLGQCCRTPDGRAGAGVRRVLRRGYGDIHADRLCLHGFCYGRVGSVHLQPHLGMGWWDRSGARDSHSGAIDPAADVITRAPPAAGAPRLGALADFVVTPACDE